MYKSVDNDYVTINIVIINVFQYIFMIVVLLNFLIAETGQTYERVRSNKENIMLMLKTTVNYEIYTILYQFGKLDLFKSFIISGPEIERANADDYTGITNTILRGFKREQRRAQQRNEDTMVELRETQLKLNKRQDKMQEEMKEVRESLREISKTFAKPVSVNSVTASVRTRA